MKPYLFFDNSPTTKTFELKMCVRNYKGEPIISKGKLSGPTKTYATDSSYKLWQFWVRNIGLSYNKRKSNKAASKQEAEKILQQMNKES